jgi:ParB/RepB/Spo0J family partition protein
MNAPAEFHPSAQLHVKLADLAPSRTNPRKRFDEKKLAELAESLKTQGVLQPLLVRELPVRELPVREIHTVGKQSSATWPFPEKYTQPEKFYAERIASGNAAWPKDGDDGYTDGVKTALQEIKNAPPSAATGRYEIIAGERRYRAAKLAGLTEVPVVVRNLTDLQVLHAQVVENLQRDDLHPLEEAEGYELLMKDHGVKAEDLGSEVGKSKAYIYAKLKLLNLCNEARTAFYDGALNESIALLIARIPVAKLQLQALKAILDKDWQGDTMSFRKARDHIQKEYMLDLAGALFDIKNADLIPKAGACAFCTKRTGNQPELFDDVKGKDVCTDTVCFGMKRAAAVLIIQEEAKVKGHTVITGKEARKIIRSPYQHSYDLKNAGLTKLTETCPQDEKGRTWGQVLKSAKLLEPAKGADKPAVQQTLIEDPQKGGMIATVSIEQAVKALRESGFEMVKKAPKVNSDPAHAKAEARIKLEVEQANAWRDKLFHSLRERISADMQNGSIAVVLYRVLAEQMYEHFIGDYDDAEKIAKLYSPDLVKTEEENISELFLKLIPAMTTQQHLMLIVDALLIDNQSIDRWNLNREPTVMLDIAKELGIDAEAIRKEAIAAIKPAAKKPAAKKAPAK